MQTAWSGPNPLTCAHCKQQIGFLATYICFNNGEKATTFHLSCHQQRLATAAPQEKTIDG
jgi:hypothetical protein